MREVQIQSIQNIINKLELLKLQLQKNDFNPKNIRLHILRRLNSEQTYTDVTGIYAVKYDVLDGWAKDENSFVKRN